MISPRVVELPRRLEPITPDTFLGDREPIAEVAKPATAAINLEATALGGLAQVIPFRGPDAGIDSPSQPDSARTAEEAALVGGEVLYLADMLASQQR